MFSTKNALIALFGLSFTITPLSGINAETLPVEQKLERLTSDFVNATRKAIPAVVSIEVKKEISESCKPEPSLFPQEIPWYLPERLFPKPLTSKFGSGTIVSKNGYILTHSDLTNGGISFNVSLHDGKEYQATLVSTDSQSKLALLKISATNLAHLTLPKSPIGKRKLVTLAFQKEKGRLATVVPFHLNSTAKRFSFGNKSETVTLGGPAVNLKGELVGVLTSNQGKLEAIGTKSIRRFLVTEMSMVPLIPKYLQDYLERLKLK